jgi:hypothetical protein
VDLLDVAVPYIQWDPKKRELMDEWVDGWVCDDWLSCRCLDFFAWHLKKEVQQVKCLECIEIVIIIIIIIKTRGVSHYGLAIYIEKYLKAKEEELWKFKYFNMQKYNLHKNPLKGNQNPSR